MQQAATAAAAADAAVNNGDGDKWVTENLWMENEASDVTVPQSVHCW